MATKKLPASSALAATNILGSLNFIYGNQQQFFGQSLVASDMSERSTAYLLAPVGLIKEELLNNFTQILQSVN